MTHIINILLYAFATVEPLQALVLHTTATVVLEVYVEVRIVKGQPEKAETQWQRG
jgi:hypothetical protein